MIKGDPTVIFLVALTNRAVSVMDVRQGDIPVSQSPIAGYNTLWVNGDPCVLG